MIKQERNAELAYKVLGHIDAHPEQWDQERWISQPGGAHCGTAGCFAGWACMLSGDKPIWEFPGDETTAFVTEGRSTTMDAVGNRAISLLNITDDESNRLFAAGNTRDELGRLVAEIFGSRPIEGVPSNIESAS